MPHWIARTSTQVVAGFHGNVTGERLVHLRHFTRFNPTGSLPQTRDWSLIILTLDEARTLRDQITVAIEEHESGGA